MHKLLLIFLLWPVLVLGNQIPLSDLIRHADIEEVKISPTGTHLAIRKQDNGERIIAIMSMKPLAITGGIRFKGKEEAGNFYWANDERVVIEVLSRKAGLEAPIFYGSLYAINNDGAQGKYIFGYLTGRKKKQLGARIKKAKPTLAHAVIIDPLPEKKNKILVSTRPWANNWENPGEVLEIDIYSGVKKRITGLPIANGRAYTDGNGNLLFARGTNKEALPQLYKKEKNGWSKVKDNTLNRSKPVGIDRETGEVYLEINRKGKTEQLVKMQISGAEYTPVFEDDISDISGIIYHPVSNKPLGVHLNPDYPKEYFFDEGDGFAAYFRGLKKAFEGHDIQFTSFTSDGDLGVLKVSGDRLPGDYFLANMTTKKVDFLASSSEWLDPKQLNPMQADAFITEDGFRIGTYLTFPSGHKHKLPMVVVPHGGPHARDYWGYDQKAQILSQNGYLVLQVNFRGSTGYGDHFYDAGRLEWGGKIQRDIFDAVNWAVEKGYADPERICIFGGSFGGYSALMNPIRYPDLYQCAIGHVGVYDLEMMYKKGDIKRRDRGLAYLKRELSKDKHFLKENSPLHNTSKLNLPLMIVHGEQDERVPVEHAELLLKQLKKEHKPVKSLIISNAGHGFYSEENNLQFYTELLRFLDQHIGVGASEQQSGQG
ncbi:prolyl oligopeptidase family serine peptidase [uncultured Microbulbifer sp.]|uniref:alpha/beta hydrolase family protein n=1 Tax=uncultured Microbulbifer sp. TaxID=348147 RepID=UPI00260AF339|nr:prolyl oligopeptidase family serine peptidase [uncultured Microbulbifer sp.]